MPPAASRPDVERHSGTEGALTPQHRRTLDALLERMFPAKEPGTGARDLGAPDYLANALSTVYRAHRPDYVRLLGALDGAAGGDFAGLPEASQNELVAAFEAGTLQGLAPSAGRGLFDLVWRHLREGLFCDPVQGGNAGMRGWRMLGFPGAQFGYTAAEQEIDADVAREPASLRDLPNAARLPPLPHLDAEIGEPDVVIVGAGPVGLLVALVLTRAGKTVTILEAGPARTGRERAMDELQATAFRNVGGSAKFNDEVPTWRRNPSERAIRPAMAQGLETALGGNSIPWGAVAMRFYEDDFRIRSATVARYGEDAVPAGSTLADWPLSYADLEPFYREAEFLLGVSGQACNIGGRKGMSGNPFEGPRSSPYPMPPLRTSGLGRLFAEAAGAEGYNPFPLPAAILTEPWNGRHACTYCSHCSRFGCHVDAKASAQNTILTEVMASGHARILTDARVLEILTDEAGRAIGVRYRRSDGSETRQLAGVVVIAAYAFENTRLLLLSATRRHRQGLGNETGQVGRHYMTRQQASVHALIAGRKLNRFIGPTAQAVAIADLSADHFDHTRLGFIRGGRIAAFNQYLPIEAAGNLPPDVQRWGAPWRDFFLEAYNSTMMLFLDAEVLPYEQNRLDLDPDETDSLGRPVTRITFDIGSNERQLIPFLQDRAEAIAWRMGATRIWRRPLLTGPISTHDVGGTRMGDDAQTSVVDAFGAVHDTPGLYVLGGSTFVSLPAANPALTLFALALRTGAHLAERP